MSSAFEQLRNSPRVARAASWYRRAKEPLCKVRRSRTVDAGPDCSRVSALSYLVLFAPVIAFVVLFNSNNNAVGGDELLMISDFEMLERFSSLWSNANANPLQAMFDIFPSGHRLDAIPNVIGHAFFGPGMHVDFFYIFCAVLLTLSVVAMARSIGCRRGVAVLAGVLLPLLIMPTFGYVPLAEDMYRLWPVLYYSAAGTVFVTALFWRIDGRSWWRSALWTAIIIAVLLHFSVTQIFHMTMMAPATMAMGLGALAASTTRKEVVSKIVCAAVIVAALAGAGIFHYLYASGINGAQYVFYQELPNFGTTIAAPQWDVILHHLGEVFYTPFSPTFHVHANVAGAVMVPLSQVGAIYLALFGQTRTLRIFGRTMLVWIVATALIIVLLHNSFYYTGRFYLGPDPRDFTLILWPYYTICLAGLIFSVAEGVVVLLSRVGPTERGALKYVPHCLVILSLAVPLTLVGARAFLHWSPPGVPDLSFFHYYQRSPIVDYLEPKIGIALDREFRGTTFFMPTGFDRDAKPYGVWRRELSHHYLRGYFGYDFRNGLHYYNIPTLDQVTHNIAPQFYLTVRELLSRPGIDAFERHFGGAVTRLNEPIMALLGLRYIIADYELPVGTEQLAMPLTEKARDFLYITCCDEGFAAVPLSEDAKKFFESKKVLKSPVRIYELPDPNLGNYSPTKVARAKTAREAIVAMSRPEFNGRHIVVTDDASIPDNLVAATGATMTVRMGGVALRASSTGESVLVLPVQYSHCWQIVSGSDASLFRANLMQLGVRFSGELRLELRQIFGPFWQSACRVEDAADVERLQMVEAFGAGTELHKVPGNGINLIPAPDALDTLFGSTVASVKASGSPNAPIREYTVTASGGLNEHYTALSVPKLAPGPYTLSMQVRADRTSNVALQIKDGTDNGAFAEYILPIRGVWVNPVGQGGDKRNATIHKIDNNWFELTLTSTLTTETGLVFVHVLDKGNGRVFVPKGEAVDIRAVKLEYGETATPYSGGGQ
jgi:hypothetical protein